MMGKFGYIFSFILMFIGVIFGMIGEVYKIEFGIGAGIFFIIIGGIGLFFNALEDG